MFLRRCLLMFIAAAFATSAMAQSNVGVKVQLNQSAPSGQAPLQSASTDFTVPPSVTSSKLNPSTQTLPLTVFCFDIFTGNIINNCNVIITHQPEAFSGGHTSVAGIVPGTTRTANDVDRVTFTVQ